MSNNSKKETTLKPTACRSRGEVIEIIKSLPGVAEQFFGKPESQQDIFLDFCTGKRPFPITYDSFFKFVFDVEKHPGRLSDFLSSIMKCRITIKQVLPNEHHVINELGHMVIMDIVVQLEDGSIVNVEIQRNPYSFLGERASCYSSDLVMREYQHLNEEHKKMDGKFNYGHMRPVYTIVLLEHSTAEFSKFPDNYIHNGRCTFDTGLHLNMLQHYIYIPLDIFQKKTQNKDKISDNLEAWLTLLSEYNEARILTLLKSYPAFADIYQEISGLRHDIKEAYHMFSEALATLDRNTQEYMVDEMRKEIEKNKAVIADISSELLKKDSVITDKDAVIADKDSAIQKQSEIIKSTLQNAIQSTIEISKDLGASKEELIPKLIDKYNLNLQESTDYVEKYWR